MLEWKPRFVLVLVVLAAIIVAQLAGLQHGWLQLFQHGW